MSIYGTMKTAVSGMNAQANRLSTVGDNIANVNTTAYKKVSTAFSSFVLPSGSGSYNSGGVTTTVVNSVSQQGSLTSTSSDTDLAINGDGFFVVQNSAGATYLTRVGSFSLNEEGYLVNANGFSVLGTEVGGIANTFSDLSPVKVQAYQLTAVATTSATGNTNLDLSAEVVDAAADDTAADNTADSVYTLKSSLTTYNNAGTEITYDVYYTKTDDNTWEVAVYDAADADPTSSTGFPYASSAITTATMNFDSSTYLLSSIETNGVVSTDLTLDIDGISLDLSKTTQYDADSFSKLARDNGNAPSSLDALSVDSAGVVYAVYENGTQLPIAQIPLATVISPDNLSMGTGNVYSLTSTSGAAVLGFAGDPGFGNIVSSSLETSNVDLANELTEMIEAQRSYTANSKVFQTGADVLDVLINLKR
ncbi:flagellar hook protein FlgE [Rhizobiaceae bacterium BDR2-2]|uniref:Flagellar hook protein FlgE n=1 Tax=Ectorhizobium quercum TaxID=2965071 RepID=A0AAE3N0N6_9HYPH|nr:flagellar hook protein FlgE [Ectorhizobium quercum]MCX8996123.1 flagellar hook protein FlgE [Ectorhizobium quercum]MCX8998838.1 flagellar hook protein FlgE [Ectorhizobium quercum]